MKPTLKDRLAARNRPEGRPLMHQTWGKLLFMHWRIEEQLLRPLIPEGLEIDTFDGSPWIAIAPFTMSDIRAFPPFVPPVPGLSSMHELNVRTYVHVSGIPGVWFFSLDCNSATAVAGARTLFFLSYYNARIEIDEQEGRIAYKLTRTDEPPAEFRTLWQIGAPFPPSEPGSLEFFLTERYCLYSEHKGALYRARIHHHPWQLRKAILTSLSSTMIESLKLPTPKGDPLLHYAEELSVDIWGLTRL